ncbi:hypothetical protein [Marinobacter sp.]|uniref:hypothetical protein n=1 Tax=Marinobacter sp. TaxID=50741 RepID=UPI003A8E7C32
MNRFTRLIACSVLVSTPLLVFAHGDEGAWQGHGPGMMMDQDQMNRNWSQMHEMMQGMSGANSPEDRQRLLNEHWKAMEEQMELMHQGMMGPGMMGGGQGNMNNQGMMNNEGMMNNQGQAKKQPGNAQGKNSGAAGMDYQQRMDLMENRMNQMQLMMEQMLEHQRQLNRN